MKILKIIGIIIIIIIVIIVITLIALFINHKNQLRNEAEKFPPAGKMVEVNDHKMHVYTEGQGDITLVFMAGHGTSSPTFDFKPLWSLLADENRIAVVEKSGYGWSETSNSPRDVGTMLEETREALTLAGEIGPFVLVPHSMSGLEAIYWAQQYPDEVIAIIGLDPLTPESYETLPEPQKTQLYFVVAISRIGLSRLIPESDMGEFLPLMGTDELSVEEKAQYLAMFYKSSVTKDMLREVDYLRTNVETVLKNEIPVNTPMHFFISSEQEIVAPGWIESLTNYLSKLAVGDYIQLETGHYVHLDNAELITEMAIVFINDIK